MIQNTGDERVWFELFGARSEIQHETMTKNVWSESADIGEVDMNSSVQQRAGAARLHQGLRRTRARTAFDKLGHAARRVLGTFARARGTGNSDRIFCDVGRDWNRAHRTLQ